MLRPSPWWVVGLALAGCAEAEVTNQGDEDATVEEDTGAEPEDVTAPQDTAPPPPDARDGGTPDTGSTPVDSSPVMDGPRDSATVDTGTSTGDTGFTGMDTGSMGVDTGADAGADSGADVALDVPHSPPGCLGGSGYTDPMTGHCYWRVGPAGWEAGRLSCASGGGHLLSVRDATENLLVRTQFTGYLPGWIGATDQAERYTWRWTTGEPFTYRNWAVGRPDYVTAGERRCVAMQPMGTWADDGCDIAHDVVCERD